MSRIILLSITKRRKIVNRLSLLSPISISLRRCLSQNSLPDVSINNSSNNSNSSSNDTNIINNITTTTNNNSNNNNNNNNNTNVNSNNQFSSSSLSTATSNYTEVKIGVNLQRFGLNLTKLSLEGKLDPVIGRDKEVERVIQILARRTKNNPILLG